MSFFKIGLGAARISELYRLLAHQVYWQSGCLYYLTISNKRASTRISNKKVVTHKLPADISRYLLIYDTIGMLVRQGREQFIFKVDEESKTTTNTITYKNKEFYNVFKELFDIEENCSGLVMRHLYTSICNYCFPNNNHNNNYSTIENITTQDTIAEMSGHSAETHNMFYSSKADKEWFFDKYHLSLGTSIASSTINESKLFNHLDKATLLNAIKIIYGTSASYFNELQSDMIYDSSNNYTSHTFCGIGCGGGKSLSWIIPTLSRVIIGMKTKMNIVVLPYCFLVMHHYSSCIDMINTTRSFSIESLIGTDISDCILPNILRDKANLPSILFISIEAIVRLIKYHWEYLLELAEESRIHKFYIDECHTILSEIQFRTKYNELKRLVAIGVPTMTLSGSFPKPLINDYMKYMFGPECTMKHNSYITENIYGEKQLKLVVRQTKSYLDDCVQSVNLFLQKYSNYNIHIIVSTIDEGMFLILKFNTNT